MRIFVFFGLFALGLAVPQRGRRFRQGREDLAPSGGYLAPEEEASSLYGAPAEEVDALYGAPAEEVDSLYGAPAEEPVADASELEESYLAPEESVPDYAEAPLDVYGAEEPIETYGQLDAAASELEEEEADPLKMLMNAVPGVPGEDYPIYAQAPETAFSCDAGVAGGYYADEEAECQVFHICTADGQGGLAKYSFLCPNGTIFNQNYFICDWWFNVDCAESAALAESRNAEIAAEAAAVDELAAASSDVVEDVGEGYGAPSEEYYDDLSGYGEDQPSYEERRRF